MQVVLLFIQVHYHSSVLPHFLTINYHCGIIVYPVQPLQAKTVSTEPSSHGVTRKASSASGFVKSPSWPSLKHAIQPITLINDVSIDPPLPCDTVVCHDNNDVTTTACQPTEEQDALYFSVNKSSLHNKGDEIMDINGPFCEGLSGCIDDYSDHATNQPEEGSTCMLTLNSECCYIPEKPLPIVIEDSPLVLQDDPNETITVSLPTNSTSSGKKHPCRSIVMCFVPSGNSSQYPVCCSAVATTSKTVVLVANEEPISS